MAPQIIYIVIIIINLINAGYRHGKPKEGTNNLWIDLTSIAIAIALLTWGGFFDVLFN